MIARTNILLLGLILVGGCSHQAVPTAASRKPLSLGSVVPDIVFATNNGQRISLLQIRRPVTILGFVAPPGEACCWLNPDLAYVADRFRELPISVVQVSTPSGRCPHGVACSEMCHLNSRRLVSLCDANRQAWERFGRPDPGTVFLVGEHARIVAVGHIGDLGKLTVRAEELGHSEVAKRERGGVIRSTGPSDTTPGTRHPGGPVPQPRGDR